MVDQEIDKNKIVDSADVNLSETTYNLYLGSLAKFCDKVTIERKKHSAKIVGENCGCKIR